MIKNGDSATPSDALMPGDYLSGPKCASEPLETSKSHAAQTALRQLSEQLQRLLSVRMLNKECHGPSMSSSIMQNPSSTQDRNIHNKVLNDLRELLTQIPQKASNQQISAELSKLEEKIAPDRKQLEKEIQSLQEHAKWDTFTIAFYGETNAGKSTTIETLRMVLGEETKSQSRRKFREIQDRDGLSTSTLTSLELQTSNAKNQLELLPCRIPDDRKDVS